MSAPTNVQVALRIRPQNAQEKIDQCSVITLCPPDEPQIIFGDKKVFTYDFVFDVDTSQSSFYEVGVQKLIQGTFEGYNATILAYGQTGSGKTYTMGSGFDLTILPENQGVIPRAVREIFDIIKRLQDEANSNGRPAPTFEIHVQFLELYNEEVIDLFDTINQNLGKKSKIHEDSNGNIYITGVTTRVVNSEEETLCHLKDGALGRRTGSTNMNAQSSRSHAIFTLHMTQTRPVVSENNEGSAPEYEVLHTKLHFVDLAGSERLKRTGATGDRAKEGISINSGLLALGNVISALGDKSKKVSHIPYRDSKLTRLLQDSLGGNSRTLMVACISPSDRDFMESLSTLKYANRARNIQNKAVINQDRTSQQLSALRAHIQKLEVELAEYRQGKIVVGADGNVVLNDLSEENTMLRAENDNLRRRLKAQHDVITSQSTRLAYYQANMEKDAPVQDHSTGQMVSETHAENSCQENNEMADVVLQYLKQIEDLKAQVCLSESLAAQTPNSPFRRAPSSVVSFSSKPDYAVRLSSADVAEETTEDILKVAKHDLSRLKLKEHRKRSSSEDMLGSSDMQNPKKNKWSVRSTSSERETETESLSCAMDTGESTVVEDSSDVEYSEDTTADDAFTSEEDNSDTLIDEEDDKISLQSDLATLSSEINIKERLIDQLEKSHKTIHSMKLQYEEKMKSLQDKIKITETQRDQMLSEAGKSNLGGKKEQEIRELYQQKLSKMESELKQMKGALKRHQHIIKSKAKNDAELRHLKSNVEDLKRQKVSLMRKMREESQQKKIDELQKQREIAQLRKEDRRKESMIKELMADKQRKDVVLKRRQEEVAALRRVQRFKPPPIAKVSQSSQKSININRRKSSVFSSDGARKKWRTIEKLITETIVARHTLTNMELEMDHWIKKRQELNERIQALTNEMIHSLEDPLSVEGLRDELETIKDNLEYVQDRIKSGQNDIMALMETKADEGDTTQVSTIIHSCIGREAKYLLEHFVDMVIKLGLESQQTQCKIQELTARLQASQQEAELIQTLMSPHIIPTSQSLPTMESSTSLNDTSKIAFQNTTKNRRRSATPKELGMSHSKRKLLNNKHISLSLESLSEEPLDATLTAVSCPPGKCLESDVEIMETNSCTDETENNDMQLLRSTGCVSRLSKYDDSPQGSPLVTSRLAHQSSSSNVFSRLTSNASTSDDNSSKGQLKKLKLSGRNKNLYCTHIAEGHTNCVLSVCATNSMLFSASQDCTAKVWDLERGIEIATLPKHPSYVRKVLYSEESNLLFTAYQSQIKVWDLRSSLQASIKNISSDSSTAVQDMVAHTHGPTLFFTAGSAIQIWNLRMMTLEGKLSNNVAPIQSLTLDDQYLVAGSRDRNVRIYKFNNTSDSAKLMVDTNNVITLHPPHYDAVTCLTLYHSKLFSACNKTLKQWSMKSHNPTIMQTNDSAHQTMITGLAIVKQSPFLISSCKNGYMKCWDAETLSLTATINARHSISCLATNDNLVFTGSSDRTIKIWSVNHS